MTTTPLESFAGPRRRRSPSPRRPRIFDLSPSAKKPEEFSSKGSTPTTHTTSPTKIRPAPLQEMTGGGEPSAGYRRPPGVGA